MTWELVHRRTDTEATSAPATTARLRVPGGWLYRTDDFYVSGANDGDYIWHAQMSFVPFYRVDAFGEPDER